MEAWGPTTCGQGIQGSARRAWLTLVRGAMPPRPLGIPGELQRARWSVPVPPAPRRPVRLSSDEQGAHVDGQGGARDVLGLIGEKKEDRVGDVTGFDRPV